MTLILLQVALGGAAGAVCRYLTMELARVTIGTGFPYGTLAVNVLGSFLMGLVFGTMLSSTPGLERYSAFLMTGFLGGYTTFSAYSLEMWQMLSTGRIGEALLYAGLSTVVAVGFLYLGVIVTRS